MQTVQFYFDYISPYAYLANSQFARLGLAIEHRPIAILDVMKAVNNQPSPQCPAKLRYALADTQRWARRYGLPLVLNTQWWAALEQGRLDMRLFCCGALAAQQQKCFAQYHDAVFRAIWGEPRDVVSADGRERLLADAGVDGVSIWQQALHPDMSMELDRRNAEAAAAGVFGVPTFAVAGELFFGNDRLDFVQERAAA